MSKKISSLPTYSDPLSSTAYVPVVIDNSTYKFDLNEIETSVDGVAINPESIGVTTPVDEIRASEIYVDGGFRFDTSRSVMVSPSDGVLLFTNNALNDFTRLQLGGTTSSYPSIKRLTTGLEVKLADDSAYTSITASRFVTTSNSINSQTGTSYSLQASDNGKIVKLTNAAAITLTVPTSLPIGFSCQVIQGGAGDVTFTPSSTTINSYGSLLTLAGQYASASIFSDATNVFLLAGNLK